MSLSGVPINVRRQRIECLNHAIGAYQTKKPDWINLVGLDQAHERLSVRCVDGGENLDLPTRAAQMSLFRVMRPKTSQGRSCILVIAIRDVK